MGTYYLPRNTKGEGRILYIFSTKSLIFTAIGGGIGALLFWILSLVGLGFIGIILGIIFAGIGFAMGTMKVPNLAFFELTRKANGDPLNEVIQRWLRFRQKKNKIYIYKGEDTNGR